jgi:phosphoglucosamine mutase
VGDRYVLEAMRAGGYNLGGEQSGHIIFTDYITTGDGLISALQLLKVIVSEGKTLKELAAQIEILPQALVNVNVPRKVPIAELPTTSALIKRIEDRLNGAGRVLVRYSGTENKLRVMLEGADQKEIERMAHEIADCAVGEIQQ